MSVVSSVTGGGNVTTDFITFTSSGTFTINKTGIYNVLIVGGGGNGIIAPNGNTGPGSGAGGGAVGIGTLIFTSNIIYNVTVGNAKNSSSIVGDVINEIAGGGSDGYPGDGEVNNVWNTGNAKYGGSGGTGRSLTTNANYAKMIYTSANGGRADSGDTGSGGQSGQNGAFFSFDNNYYGGGGGGGTALFSTTNGGAGGGGAGGSRFGLNGGNGGTNTGGGGGGPTNMNGVRGTPGTGGSGIVKIYILLVGEITSLIDYSPSLLNSATITQLPIGYMYSSNCVIDNNFVTFYNSGWFIVTTECVIETLIVAGGGNGNTSSYYSGMGGGGGGAGAVGIGKLRFTPNTIYNVIVGSTAQNSSIIGSNINEKAYAGGSGGSVPRYSTGNNVGPGYPGGSGGGACGAVESDYIPNNYGGVAITGISGSSNNYSSILYYGNSGGNSTSGGWNRTSTGAGGGGAGTKGSDSVSIANGSISFPDIPGGKGIKWKYDNIYYGIGGGGGIGYRAGFGGGSSTKNAIPYIGGGGGGGSQISTNLDWYNPANDPAGSGGSGIVKLYINPASIDYRPIGSLQLLKTSIIDTSSIITSNIVENTITNYSARFLTIKSSGLIILQEDVSCKILLVGGGGGGGTNNGSEGGGGGGGGAVGIGNIILTKGTLYTITIGIGGTGAAINTVANGTNGGNTSIVGGTINETANGGGGGGWRPGVDGGSGGGASGHGGSYYGGKQTCGTSLSTKYASINYYGNCGGYGRNGNGGAGGGGANEKGYNTTSYDGANGGSGICWNENGIYYGGGGGGAKGNAGGGGSGAGGNGGGGNGAVSSAAVDGTINTGGGGGGGNTSGKAGNGGSGIIILAFNVPSAESIFTPISASTIRNFLGLSGAFSLSTFRSNRRPNSTSTEEVNFSNYFASKNYKGLTPLNPASNALDIKLNTGTNTDGLYYITSTNANNNFLITQPYCLMNSKYDGGGWMLLMKTTNGTTFTYSSSYWTTNNTLNSGDLTLNNANAKYDYFNYNPIKDVMAIWPVADLTAGTSGGSLTIPEGWVWIVNNWYNSGGMVPSLHGFQFNRDANPVNPDSFNGMTTTIFSRQGGAGRHVFGGYSHISGAGRVVRWGFVWNNEGDFGSIDVSNGLGTTNYSSGDDYGGCCTTSIGYNRSIRVQLFGR